MKTLLYPKNSQQMWEEFLKGRETYDFYHGNEELVRDAIERTHDIAWQKCEDVWIDTNAKLPSFDKPGNSAFKQLAELCKEALIIEGLADKSEYIERLKHELSDVKYLKFENYFLTLHAIFKEASKKCLIGPARGSGGGSLINYLLRITHVDPVEHGLVWERFLGRHRCLESSTKILTSDGIKSMKDIKVGDLVMTHTGEYKKIIDKEDAIHDYAIKVKFKGQTIVCSPNHRWIVDRDGKETEVIACMLQKGDKLILMQN